LKVVCKKQKEVESVDRKLIYVVNHFRAGAVPNIILDILPFINKEYNVRILSLQKINKEDYAYQRGINQRVSIDSLNLNRLNLISAYSKLSRYLNNYKPDIIHSHLGRADIFSTLCKPKNSKLVTTFHSVKSNYNIVTRIGYFLTDKFVDMRTSVSDTVRMSWYEKGLLKSRNCTIYNPVDINKFNKPIQKPLLKKELGIPENDSILINIGNVRRQKGQIYLVKALSKLIEQNKNVSLIIVGRYGDSIEELTAEINRLNLQDRVFLVGFRNDIPQLLNISDIFVFPSLTEGLGIAVLEAMASGVPVVASNISAISEYIKDSKDGYLVKYDDVVDMTNKIQKLLENHELTKEITSNAFTKVEEMFNSKRIAEKYMGVYNSLFN
jgi:glycosyltransferase involved in cell wall biosynthesis